MQKAHEKGLRIAFNAAPYGQEVLGYPLETVTWLIVNEVEGAGISGKTDFSDIAETLVNRYPGMNIMLTMGKAAASIKARTRRCASARAMWTRSTRQRRAIRSSATLCAAFCRDFPCATRSGRRRSQAPLPSQDPAQRIPSRPSTRCSHPRFWIRFKITQQAPRTKRFGARFFRRSTRLRAQKSPGPGNEVTPKS